MPLSIDELTKIKTMVADMKKNLKVGKVADFPKFARQAEDILGKPISNKILAFEKAILSKNVSSTPKKVEKVKSLGDKLQEVLGKKGTKATEQIKKIAEKEKKAKAKAAKAAKPPAAKKAKSTKAKSPKSKKTKSKSPASFMWGGEEAEESDLEFL